MADSKQTTETFPPQEQWLDELADSEALGVMAEDQALALEAVRGAMPQIEEASVAVYARLKDDEAGGRLFYGGAGTSGRIGVQDGVELVPTFGWSYDRLGFLLAGGDAALMRAIEGAEDDIDSAKLAVEDAGVGESDVVIGISASGATPFTCEVLRQASEKGALTIGIANNEGAVLVGVAEYGIELLTGGEVIAGSTRLKAATSQKICLNMISSLVMTRLGRVRHGLMVDMQPSNEKLRARASRIAERLKEE